MRIDFLAPCKRRRFSSVDSSSSMDPSTVKAKLEAAKQKCGREIRIFETLVPPQTPNEVSNGEDADEFYNFTAEDYYRVLATKKDDKYLKTRKIREAEEAARRSRMTKTIIRVRFPDNNTLEATFHPSEPIQNLVDLLMKVVAQPGLPFYIYTTPPKKQVRDMSEDFYSAGFVPGAIVYFSYDLPKGDESTCATSGPFLEEEIMSLKGLELIPEQSQPDPVPKQSAPEPVIADPPRDAPQGRKPADKKPVRPKWLKM